MFRIRKKFRFEAAHQLASSFSPDCHETIHGHSYIVEVILKARELNKDGMVLDFGCLKIVIDKIKEQWDHALIMPVALRPAYSNQLETGSAKVFWTDQNPTAELMARLVFRAFQESLREAAQMDRVRVHETETGWAEYSEETT